MPIANQTPASLLLASRNSPNTHASALANDFLHQTWKGAAGGETFTIGFFDIHSRELTDPVTVSTLGTDEASVAALLTSTTAATAWEDGLSLYDWVIANSAIVPEIAFLRISDITGTVYIGAGATSNKPYGEFEDAVFTITGPAAGTTRVLTATDYGITA